MKNLVKNRSLKYALAIAIVLGIISAGFFFIKISGDKRNHQQSDKGKVTSSSQFESSDTTGSSSGVIKEAKGMPVYGHWRNFTTKNGLPSDKAYTVRIDEERVLVGTHDGLAVYETGKWHTYTTKDGLAHNGIVSIDVSELTGDVWIGTLGGLTRWSAGKFERFTQSNRG